MFSRLGGGALVLLAIAACGVPPQPATEAPDVAPPGATSDRRVQSYFDDVFDSVFEHRNDRDRDRRRRQRERERDREDDNRNPRVSLDWEPNPFRLGEAILTADATDRDGDRLRYRWEALYGEIEGSGPQVIYTPRYFGHDEVIVQIRDGEGGFDVDSVVIEVEDLFDFDRGRFSFF